MCFSAKKLILARIDLFGDYEWTLDGLFGKHKKQPPFLRKQRIRDDLASEVEADRTRQKIRRDLAKFRRRLQERVQLLLS